MLVASVVLLEMSLRVGRIQIPLAAQFEPGVEPGVKIVAAEIEAADGVLLKAAWVPVAGSTRCVIVLHGVGDSHAGALGFAPMFVEAGYSALAPDSRAHGWSGGERVSFGVKEADDLLLWVRWLRAQNWGQSCEKLYALGESMGAAVLIQAAAKQAVFAAIVAECSFSDFRTIGSYRVQQIVGAPLLVAKPLVWTAALLARLLYGLDLNLASPVESARRLTTPLLLIHGLEDTNIPPSHTRAIAAAQPHAAVWLVAGAGHVDAYRAAPKEFRQRVLSWFQQH